MIKEVDVVKFLIKRKEVLQEELNKIDHTLEVIESSGKALSGTLRESENILSIVSKRTIEIPAEYDPNDAWDKRILFVLSKIKRGNKALILNQIQDYEPSAYMTKLNSVVSTRLSVLLKTGQIKGVKNGKMYTYSLN